MMAPRKLLLIRGGALGDFILTLPVLAALRRHFPSFGIEILGYERVASLAVAAGLADRVSALESPALAGFFARDGERQARAHAYFGGFEIIVSYVYDPEGIFQSNVLCCGPARFLVGSHRPDDLSGLHAAKFFLRPLEILGIHDADALPHLSLPGQDALYAKPRLAVHPGSGSPRKNWPESKWAEFLNRLATTTEWHFLLIGGEAEGERCDRLAATLPPDRTRLAQNLPLMELAQTMRSCVAFIGHDSGITHLAAALDLPGLVLWGPSNEAIWRPLSQRMRVIRDERGLEALPVTKVLGEAQSLGTNTVFRA